MIRVINLMGKIFGRLVVISEVDRRFNRKAVWLCNCICGNELEVVGCDLRSGRKSGINGVSLEKNKHWVSNICTKGIYKSLYRGNDFFEACCARKSAELKYWGSIGE